LAADPGEKKNLYLFQKKDMSDFTSRMNAIHEHNFGSNKNNQNKMYNSNINSNTVYYSAAAYNTAAACSNINNSRGTTVIYANNIPLWFSQNHCRISG
jgi:hypothetical protein